MKIRRRMGETKQIVQVNGGNILLFELAFRLLTLPLLLQAVAALFRLSVRASGYSYVTVSNLVSYLLRPVTIAILVLMAAILLVGVSIEAAGLLAAYQAAALSRKMSAFSMFAAGIRLTVSEIRKRNLRLFLVLAVHGLVLHSFLIYRMLCHVKAVKFILPALLAENWGRLLLVGVIVGAVVISLPTIFICFGCMLEQRSFRGGFLRSRELLRGNRVQVVGTLVLCNLAVTAVTVVLYLIAVVIVAVFAVWFADRRLELILVLEARDRIEMVLMPLMSIALMSVNYGALTVLYVQLDRKRQNKERWKFEAGEHAGLPWLSRRNRMTALALLTALSAGAMYDAFYRGNVLAADQLRQETRSDRGRCHQERGANQGCRVRITFFLFSHIFLLLIYVLAEQIFNLHSLGYQCLTNVLYKLQRFWVVSVYTDGICLDGNVVSVDALNFSFFYHSYDTFDCQVFIFDDCSRKFSGNQGSVIVVCTVCEHLARCL